MAKAACLKSRKYRVRAPLPHSGLKNKQEVSPCSLVKIQYCGEPLCLRVSVLGLRPPGVEFRILCLKGIAISFISPSSGDSLGSVKPICAQRCPKAPFIQVAYKVDWSDYNKSAGNKTLYFYCSDIQHNRNPFSFLLTGTSDQNIK